MSKVYRGLDNIAPTLSGRFLLANQWAQKASLLGQLQEYMLQLSALESVCSLWHFILNSFPQANHLSNSHW